MFPYCANTASESVNRSASEPIAAEQASRIRGPPGWTAHEPISSIAQLMFAEPRFEPRSQRASMEPGTCVESAISKP